MPYAPVRERLSDLEGRVRELREQRKTASAARDAAREQFTARADADTSSPEFKRAQDAANDLRAVEGELELAQAEQTEMLRTLSDGGSAGWLSPEAREGLETFAHSQAQVGRVNIGELVSRAAVANMIGGAAPMAFGGMAQEGEVTIGEAPRRAWRGISPQLRRPLRLLDLFPAQTTDQNAIEFSVESGDLDTAAETVEGEEKPKHDGIFTDAEARARTIAHWTKAKKQQLADVPAIQRAIQGRLTYGVLRRLENAIVSGSGLAENIRGILNTDGVPTIEFDAGELPADQVLEGLAGVLVAEATPTFVALSPRDWVAMLKQKADGTGQSGEYYSGGPFVAAAERLWGVTAVPSTGVPDGTALVGDATIGASVFVRSGVNVLVSDADGDDFTHNRVTLLAEGRFAFAVWQPDAFAVVEVASS